jgi:hypothetical protein
MHAQVGWTSSNISQRGAFLKFVRVWIFFLLPPFLWRTIFAAILWKSICLCSHFLRMWVVWLDVPWVLQLAVVMLVPLFDQPFLTVNIHQVTHKVTKCCHLNLMYLSFTMGLSIFYCCNLPSSKLYLLLFQTKYLVSFLLSWFKKCLFFIIN